MNACTAQHSSEAFKQWKSQLRLLRAFSTTKETVEVVVKIMVKTCAAAMKAVAHPYIKLRRYERPAAAEQHQQQNWGIHALNGIHVRGYSATNIDATH